MRSGGEHAAEVVAFQAAPDLPTEQTNASPVGEVRIPETDDLRAIGKRLLHPPTHSLSLAAIGL
eukprot:CAMPEP_0117569974 /NCGR_PEP_ID=MMETSP0784-20121206/58946_1 /TAXON_ID=39447 /ORGANISM="" /LENGTH=63 /DNA_ID=CAMNT_0005367987 /DNA_START=36 /DNA_END=228 /DNA_ORIENTATION=-